MTESGQSPQPSNHAKPPTLGLLGGPGSGKSFVAGLLAECGGGVIDADDLARKALSQPAVLETLRGWWGDDVSDNAGQPNRQAIAARVFERPDELARLEGVIHPLVETGRQDLREQYEADPATRLIVEDCPLLLEKKLDGPCDALLLVDTPRSIREARVRQTRGWSAADLAERQRHQWPITEKRRRADFVLDGSQDRGVLRSRLARIVDELIVRFG